MTMAARSRRSVRRLRGGRALDLVGELAERAHGAGGDLSTARALLERDRFHALESHARAVEEAEEEVVLGARRRFFHPAQDLLVGDRRRAHGERTLLDDVVDAAKEG